VSTTTPKLVAVLAITGLVGAGGGFALGRRPAAMPEQPPPKADPNAVTAFPALQPKDFSEVVAQCPRLFGEADVAIGPADSTLVQLQKARLNAARTELKQVIKLWRSGALLPSDREDVMFMCDKAVYAAADLDPDPKALRPWFEERVRVAKWYESETEAHVRARIVASAALSRARFARLDAEIALLRLDQKPAGKSP
jgi:hypothetical protein